YRFDLIGTDHYIVYYGIMMPDISAGRLIEDQVFAGEIQSGGNDPELLPVFAGIYLMEEKFRRIEKHRIERNFEAKCSTLLLFT
ncbi:MAG: hypothetical protein ABI480_15205, partial [Chitinophagaceae bacterium]